MTKTDDKQKEESGAGKYKWNILFFSLSFGASVVGAIIRAQSDEMGLVMFIGGAFMSASIFLGSLIWKVREDSKQIVTEYVNDVRVEFHSAIDSLSGNLGAIWTPTFERNLEIAEDMTQRLKSLGLYGAGYDTSSHVNPDSYERLVLENVRSGVYYQRLICFDPDDEDSATRKWYEEMMNADEDEEKRFTEWRRLMYAGKAQILHLPRALDMDILVTNRKGTNKYEALLGFVTEEVTTSGVYSSGLHVPAPQTGAKNLAEDLYDLFKNLWREACKHAMDQKDVDKDPEDRCLCNIYVKVQGDIVKNSPNMKGEEVSD